MKRNKFILSLFTLSALMTGLSQSASADDLFYGQNTQQTVPAGNLNPSSNIQGVNDVPNYPNTSNQNVSVNVANYPTSQPQGLPVLQNGKQNDRIVGNSFKETVNVTGGLTPDMIRQERRLYSNKRAAILEPVTNQVVPQSRIIPVGLGISNQKEILNLTKGYTTTLYVVDATGKAWNVNNVVIGNANAFKVSRLDGEKGSLFALTALADYARSNIVLVLDKGYNQQAVTPITLDLVSSQKTVDDRVELRVEGVGSNGVPNANILTQGIDSKFLSWSMGVVPQGVISLKTSNPDVKAWQDVDGSIVVQTGYFVYSPNASMIIPSADGNGTLYKLNRKVTQIRARDLTTKEEKTINISGF